MPAEIRQYVEPRRIYRFRGFGIGRAFDRSKVDQEVKALGQGYVWCARYSDMNDPMEGLYYAGSQVRGMERWEQARQAIRDGKANTGICAFTESLTNELMWAHYASNFSGIAAEYDFALLRQGLPEESAFSRMVYADAMPEVTEIDGSPEDNIRAVLSTKNYRWAYEREWRLFTALPGRTAYQTQNALTALYIGSRIDQETEGKLRQAANELAIPVRKLKIRGYGLEFDPPVQR